MKGDVEFLEGKRKIIDLKIFSLKDKEMKDHSIKASLHCYMEKESVGVLIAAFKNMGYLLFMPNIMQFLLLHQVLIYVGFSDDSDSKESACNAGNAGLIPRSRRSPGEGNGNPLQYSCLENCIDIGAWWATVHGVTKELDMTAIATIHMCRRHI